MRASCDRLPLVVQSNRVLVVRARTPAGRTGAKPKRYGWCTTACMISGFAAPLSLRCRLFASRGACDFVINSWREWEPFSPSVVTYSVRHPRPAQWVPMRAGVGAFVVCRHGSGADKGWRQERRLGVLGRAA